MSKIKVQAERKCKAQPLPLVVQRNGFPGKASGPQRDPPKMSMYSNRTDHPIVHPSVQNRSTMAERLQRKSGNLHTIQALGRSRQLAVSARTPGQGPLMETGGRAENRLPLSRITRRPLNQDAHSAMIQAAFGEVPMTPGWAGQVQQARSGHTEMDLLNRVYTRMYPDIAQRFPELRLPVRLYRRGTEVDGGVYFDASQSDPGMTDQRTVTSGGGCEEERSETYVFIVLGPGALSEGTPKYSENILYHEYVHYLQRKGRMHQRLLSGTDPHRRNVHREALAHAESFRHYFGQLYWQGSGTMPGGRTVAEALYSLELLNQRFYEPSDDPVRIEVIRLLTSVIQAPNPSQKAAFLRELANHLSVSGWTHQSVLRNDLLHAIEP